MERVATNIPHRSAVWTGKARTCRPANRAEVGARRLTRDGQRCNGREEDDVMVNWIE